MLTREDDIDVHALRRQGWTISAIARHQGFLIPYGGSAVKSAELTLRLATEDTDVLERQRPLLDGHGVPALVGVNVVHARCAARAPR